MEGFCSKVFLFPAGWEITNSHEFHVVSTGSDGPLAHGADVLWGTASDVIVTCDLMFPKSSNKSVG